MVTSGVLLGAAAMTTRGMGEEVMREIGELVAAAVRGEPRDLRVGVASLTEAHPLYA